MSEENLVRQCAPTLAGIKTGTIFPAPFTSLAELTAEIRELNRILVPKGLRLLPLRYQDHTALLYLYRPAELRVDLKDQLAEALLADAGYSGKSSEQCVAYLAKRFRSGGEFPHEVGLFLSYPPQDVRGFIENHAVNYKCAGLWKVYGDEALARRLLISSANALISTAPSGVPVPALTSWPSQSDIPTVNDRSRKKGDFLR